MIDRLLNGLASLSLRHSKLIAIVAVVLFLASLAAGSRLTFDPDLLNLIPQNNRQVNDFRKVLKDMGTIDNHIVVMHLPKGRDVHDYDALIEEIATGYKNSKRIEEVQYRIPDPLDFVELILPKAMLFLTPAEVEQVGQKLTDEAIRQSVERSRTLLQTPQSAVIKQLIQYDPFNFVPLFLGKFTAAGGGFKIDASSGYFLSSDHSMLLIIAKPKKPAQDVPFGKELLAEGAILEARALANWRQSAPPGTPMPRIEHTGGYQIAAGDADLIRGDVIVNVLGSFFGVLVLFLYAFRRVASLLYAALPMALGLAMTFAVAALTYGQLSSASAGFAALLAGLGIDFITVLYGRYVDERNRGASMAHGLVVAIRTSMPGITIAAITTAATFYAFLATDFRGMTQLGFLTGTGILFFLVCIAFLLPSLIVMGERGGAKRAPRLYLHSFGSDRLIRKAIANPKPTIVLWTVFTVICAVAATQVRFSDNIQDLRSKENVGVVNQEAVTKKFGQSFDFMMYVVQGKTMDEVVAKTHAAARDLQPLVKDGTISSYQSISTFLPPQEQQQAVIDTLARGRATTFNFERIRNTFRAALAANGFRPEAYDSYLQLFQQTLAPTEPLTLDSIKDENLRSLMSRFVKPVPGGFMSVINVYPSGGKWPRDVPEKLLAVTERHPGDVLTGVNLVSGTLRRIVHADAIRSTAVGITAVLLLMIVSFRNAWRVLLAFVPFLAGVIGMVGIMAMLRLELNFMNIFVGLMIIGCATDYAVYMLQRYIEDPGTFGVTAAETGKAIVTAGLTTIVGYGSFALSHFPGLRSIGYASTFGIGLSSLAAITLLPAILVLGKRTNEQSHHTAADRS